MELLGICSCNHHEFEGGREHGGWFGSYILRCFNSIFHEAISSKIARSEGFKELPRSMRSIWRRCFTDVFMSEIKL